MNCPPKYEVHCGMYMMKGEAHFWWKGAQKTIIPQEEFITWCQFKDAYLHKYYPITARVKMQTTFLKLKQGDRSVKEYDLEFNRLARFFPTIYRWPKGGTKRECGIPVILRLCESPSSGDPARRVPHRQATVGNSTIIPHYSPGKGDRP